VQASGVRPLLVRLATRYLRTPQRGLYTASGGRIGSRIWVGLRADRAAVLAARR